MALRNSAAHEEFIRQIKSFMKIEGLEFDPERPNEVFVDNLFRPTFAHLIGWDGDQYRRVKVNDAGRIQMSITSGGYSDYAVYNFVGITSATIHDFGSVYDKLYVHLNSGNMQLQIDSGDGTFGDEIDIEYMSDIWVPVNVERVQIDDDGAACSGYIWVVK